jgi:hypothetical protein
LGADVVELTQLYIFHYQILKQPKESGREIEKRKVTHTMIFHGNARSNNMGNKNKKQKKQNTVGYKYSHSLVNPGGLSS